MEKFEALEILRNMVCTEDYLKEMQKISCNALEKQIPKKVIVNKDGCRNCPNCYANESWICYEQDINEPFEYCSNCGQKLDWGITEYNPTQTIPSRTTDDSIRPYYLKGE